VFLALFEFGFGHFLCYQKSLSMLLEVTVSGWCWLLCVRVDELDMP